MAHPLSGAAAIVGLGITPQGKVYGNTPVGFAVDAVALALADAGLERGDLDGLLLNPGLAWTDMGMGSFQLQQAMGRRHMHRYGTTQDHLGAVAVAQRRWANLNPAAQLQGQPLTLEDYHRSRWIVEPFHLFDCCLVSNGGLAVIVTGRERARDLRKPPVYIRGMAQGHLGGDASDTLSSGAVVSREPAFRMAGLTLRDVDVVELYDCYTFTVIVTLEDYGFCPKGEGGPFAAEYVTGPGGRLAVNTGGGQLSSFYMWGMTPVSEGVIQVRGEGGRRQAAKHDVALVSGRSEERRVGKECRSRWSPYH